MSCQTHARAAVETNRQYGGMPIPNRRELPDLPSGVRLTKDQMRKHFPKEVFAYVDGKMKRMRTRRVKYSLGNHERGLYLDEGATYWVWDSEKGAREVTMVSEFSGWAGNDPVSRAVGKTTPVGQDSWVVESEYFLGEAFIRVHYFPPLDTNT